jgi:hypothetical protein
MNSPLTSALALYDELTALGTGVPAGSWRDCAERLLGEAEEMPSAHARRLRDCAGECLRNAHGLELRAQLDLHFEKFRPVFEAINAGMARRRGE